MSRRISIYFWLVCEDFVNAVDARYIAFAYFFLSLMQAVNVENFCN